eukprot:2435042-Lingulodinium_polyedra.AAC.1
MFVIRARASSGLLLATLLLWRLRESCLGLRRAMSAQPRGNVGATPAQIRDCPGLPGAARGCPGQPQ